VIYIDGFPGLARISGGAVVAPISLQNQRQSAKSTDEKHALLTSCGCLPTSNDEAPIFSSDDSIRRHGATVVAGCGPIGFDAAISFNS